jgi:hypothetical protein
MQSVTQPDINHTVLSSGVDWITATAQKGSTRWEMETFAAHEFERARDAGHTTKTEFRQGYYGHSVEGFFHGSRQGGSIIVASGRTAHDIFRSVVEVSDHIARLDAQVTIYTPEDKPDLARHAFEVLRHSPPASKRVRNCTHINTHPIGGTCNVGKRSSDSYGRIYDKAAEAKLGEARTVWRYEVEYKRMLAVSAAAHLRSSDDSQASSRALVHRWFSDRGLEPAFTPRPFSSTDDLAVSRPRRDVGTWLAEVVSKSVARLANERGLREVEKLLGLPALHDLNCERRLRYAAECRCSISRERVL